MPATQPITLTSSGPHSLGDAVAEIVPLTRAVYVAGPPVLGAWAGLVLFALMLAGPFALLVTLVVVFAALATLVTLAGAVLASPYLVLRHVHRRLAARRRIAEANAAATAPTLRTTTRPAPAALATSMTARTS
jgi:hypothetical protein